MVDYFAVWRKLSKNNGRKAFISILVIARNDETRIEGVIRGCLADYVNECGCPNFEVVAISEGSKDQTPAILERLGRDESRLKTKSVSSAESYKKDWLYVAAR